MGIQKEEMTEIPEHWLPTMRCFHWSSATSQFCHCYSQAPGPLVSCPSVSWHGFSQECLPGVSRHWSHLWVRLVFTVDLTKFGTAVGNGVCVCDGVSRKGLTEEGRLTWIWAAPVHGPGSWESEPSISAHLSRLLCLRSEGWWDLGEWSLQMRLTEVSGDSQLYSEHRIICTLRVKKTHTSKVHNHKDVPHMAKHRGI